MAAESDDQRSTACCERRTVGAVMHDVHAWCSHSGGRRSKPWSFNVSTYPSLPRKPMPPRSSLIRQSAEVGCDHRRRSAQTG